MYHRYRKCSPSNLPLASAQLDKSCRFHKDYSGCTTLFLLQFSTFSWKMQSDVWGTVTANSVSHITEGNSAQGSIRINIGWLKDFLWAKLNLASFTRAY